MLAAGVSCVSILVARPAAAVDFTFTTTAPVAVDTLGHLFKVKALLSHNEPDSVKFIVTKQASFPIGWSASLCVNGLCYAPFVDQVPEEEAYFYPGRVDTIATWFQSGINQGTGSATISVAPAGAPEQEVRYTLSAITTGVDLLIVDDDGGEAYDSLCAAALPAPMKAGTWIRSSAPVDADELAKFPRVVWLTGEASPSLDDADRAAISAYLAGGGEMLLSGQNIAYSLCGSASTEFSEEACDWLRDTFHVAYMQDDAGSASVSGIAGDPIGDALAFEIEGGTGANNQTSPDLVTADENGVPFLVYGGGGAGARDEPPAGVRNVTHCPTTVFLGFGFEGIADAADREALLARVLGYMDASVPDPDSCSTLIAPVSNQMLSLGRNPFQPTGESPTMEFVIRLAPPAVARLDVFDTSGRLVRTLFEGEITASETSVAWDGLDDDKEELPGGVYFARLSTDGASQTQKTILLK